MRAGWGSSRWTRPEEGPHVIRVKPARRPHAGLCAPHPRAPVGALSHELKVWFWPTMTMYELLSIFNRVTEPRILGKLQPHLGGWNAALPQTLLGCLVAKEVLRSFCCYPCVLRTTCLSQLLFKPTLYHLLDCFCTSHITEKINVTRNGHLNFLPSIAVMLWYNKKCVFLALPLAPGQSPKTLIIS